MPTPILFGRRNSIKIKDMKIATQLSIVLFFVVTGVLLITMNSRNLIDYSLHHMLVEAVAERRIVNLGGSYSQHLQPNGDVLTYQGKVYPIKQPGIGIIGGMLYLPLSKLGIKYSTDYLHSSGWVTLWTTIIPSALIAVIIFFITFKITKKYRSSMLIGAGVILTTTMLPYSNFPHHDTVAMLPLYWAIHCLLEGYITRKEKSRRDYVFYAGVLLGFSFFFSMLPLSFIPSLGIIVLWSFGFKETIKFASGGFLGIIPSLMYNYFVLGGLLHFPNLMGSSVDTIPSLSINQIYYLGRYIFQPGLSIILFAPLAVLGLYRTIVATPKTDYEYILKRIVLLCTVFFLFHLSSFETEGDLQYGPRYLLPLIPLWFLGLRDLLDKRYLRLVLMVLGLYGFGINILGALYGAMYKYITVFPLSTYYSYLTNPTQISYPFRSAGYIFTALAIVLLIFTYYRMSYDKKILKK